MEGERPREPLYAAPLICFEDLFPYLSRNAVRLGARVLLNATNDAWFEGSREPEHHMRQSIFRAVENRVYLLRSTATGVTCVVDPLGRVERLTDADGSSVSFAGFHTAALSIPKQFTPTFYTRHGDVFFALPAAVFLIVVLVFLRRRANNGA
jgi:apolipoprotein N-acyltransferase